VRAGDTITYALQVVLTGNTANGTIVTDDLPPELEFVSFGEELPEDARWAVGQTLTWNMGDLAPGTYTLTYRVRVKDFTETGVALTNHAGVTWIGATPVAANVSVTVTGDFTVRVGVYNEAGELVKEILVKQYSQPLSDVEILEDSVISSLEDTAGVYYKDTLIGTWDGTSANGKPAPNGEYMIKVDNIDAYGVVQSVTKEVTVLRALSDVQITVYNEAGEAVRRLYAKVDDPSSLVTDVTLSQEVIAPSYGEKQAGIDTETAIQLSNGVAVLWDGRTDSGEIVPNGEYYIEVKSVDGNGSEIVVTRNVTVMGMADAVKEVKVAPNRLTVGSSVAHMTGEAGVALKVTIYDVAGEKVAVVKSAGPGQEATWDGRSAANGLYIAVVEMYAADGRFLGRKTVKILNLSR